MGKTIEQKVADTLLQKPRIVTIGHKKYKVNKPTIGTLLLMSELVSQLPTVELKDNENYISWSIGNARDGKIVCDVASVLILGSKCSDKRFLNIPFLKMRREKLSKKILTEMSPSEVSELLLTLLKEMEIYDFFDITTFLIKANLTRPTREVVMTAFGQQ